MTATLPQRRYRFSILRTLFCGILMSALLAVCLYIDHTAITFLHERLLEADMKTSAWLVNELGLNLPLIVLCLFPYLVYSRHDRRDGDARREMMWAVVVVAMLIYGVLLPYLSSLSEAMYEAAVEAGNIIPVTEGKVDWTLLMKLHEWFVRLPIPLCILILYHKTRADRERRHPETEACDAPMTVAEYEALHATPAAPVDAEATVSMEDSATDTPIQEANHA